MKHYFVRNVNNFWQTNYQNMNFVLIYTLIYHNMKNLLIVALAFLFSACNAQTKTTSAAAKSFAVNKTEADWKKQLGPLAFDVTRKEGTERAYTGKYWDNHQKGIYTCICCGQEIFNSDTKFESGT